MSSTIIALFTCMLLSVTTASAADSGPPLDKSEHPGDVALLKAPSGKWTYRSFPGQSRLYVSEGDRPGKSNCNAGCDSAWSPLLAREHEVGAQVGDWTVIGRDDGRKQWSYKGKPVYVRYHDIELTTTEAGIDGFHLLEP